MSDKEIFIPSEYMVIEQAELFADMEARQKGFSKKSPQWEKAKQKYLEERYYHSDIPHLSNPYSPHIPVELYKLYGGIFGPAGSIAKQVGFDSAHYKAYEKRIRKSVTDLVHVYLELHFGFQATQKKALGGKSSFKLYKGDSKQAYLEKMTRDYVRYTASSLILTVLQLVFTVNRDTMIELMEEARVLTNTEARTIPSAPGSKPGKDPRAYMLNFLKHIKQAFVRRVKIQP